MRTLLHIIIFTLISLPATAQVKQITYTESREDFRNPERGFYIPSQTKTSNFVPLDPAQLKAFRSSPQQLGTASYAVNISLLYRAYELDNYKDKPLSPALLQLIQKDFDEVRKAGLKLILRFAYTNTASSGDCKDEYKICPPYGDAPRHIVMEHVRQLKPLFQKNADIIAVLQQGFIGIWGENYFTDYFGCATDDGQGVIPDSSWVHRNEFLKALLDAMPKTRMVQVRTPQIKQRFVYGARALPTAEPLKIKGAFTKTDMARVGFHNDCFLASPDDYGTFYDYGNSVSKRDTANFIMRRYFEKDSRFVAVGGETCDDAYSPQNDCGPAGNAENEMAAMHYSYLNAAYNNQVNNDWDSMGCMARIKQNLGYRLVLQKAVVPARVKAGGTFQVKLSLVNRGYAAPFNPRPVQLILRNLSTGTLLMLNWNVNVQAWFAGKVQLQQRFTLPAATPKGEYELLINLPDGYKTLQQNPAYSIRLANTGTWEATSGYNKLNHILQVD